MYDPMNGQMGPMNNAPMYGPMNGQMGPMNNGPMYDPMNNQMGPMNNGPMYDPMNNQMAPAPMNQEPMPDLMAKTNNESNILPQPNDNKDDAFFGAPNTNEDISGLNNGFSSQKETLFGAPMYSDEDNKEEKNEKTVDIFGQLLTDDMGIRNSDLSNDLPSLNSLNSLNAPLNQNMNQNMNQSMNQNMNPANNMMGNPNPPMNNNRNWTFIDNGQNNQQQNMNGGSQLFQKNILEDAQKLKEERSMQAPTNNKDYYEDMKTGDFVNFSDLNKGNVKEEDTNKYMGVQVEENKPQFDLNLENNTEEDNKFDDFYE